jgi:hypothetical protein
MRPIRKGPSRYIQNLGRDMGREDLMRVRKIARFIIAK